MDADPSDKIAKKLGARLRAKRIKAGLSMNALAQAAGLDQRFVSRVEKGEQMPSLKSLMRLCDVLVMKLEELFEGM